MPKRPENSDPNAEEKRSPGIVCKCRRDMISAVSSGKLIKKRGCAQKSDRPRGIKRFRLHRRFFIIAAALLVCLITAVSVSTAARGKIDDLKLSNATSTQMKVSWHKVKRATSYQIKYAPSKDFKSAKTVSSKKPAAVLKGLEDSTKYYVTVRAVKAKKNAAKTKYYSWSPALSASTGSVRRASLLDALSSAKTGSDIKVFGSDYDIAASKRGKDLAAAVEKIEKLYKVSFILIDIESLRGVSLNADRTMYSASCLKGPYVAAINMKHTNIGSEDEYLMDETIKNSDNNTYDELHDKYGSAPMLAMMKYSDVSSFGGTLKYDFLPVRDLAKLWTGTYWYFCRDTNSRSGVCRDKYTDSLNSFIHMALEDKYKVNTKAGWYSSADEARYNVQNDAGIVFAKSGGVERAYILAVMTSACGHYNDLSDLVIKLDAVHDDMIK